MTSALKGGGGPGKADKVREFSKGGCVKMRTRGEGCQKIGKFCGRHKWKAPYNEDAKIAAPFVTLPFPNADLERRHPGF